MTYSDGGYSEGSEEEVEKKRKRSMEWHAGMEDPSCLPDEVERIMKHRCVCGCVGGVEVGRVSSGGCECSYCVHT